MSQLFTFNNSLAAGQVGRTQTDLMMIMFLDQFFFDNLVQDLKIKSKVVKRRNSNATSESLWLHCATD